MDILKFTETLSNKLAISDSMSAFLLVFGLLLMLGFKLFNFWSGRLIEKEEQQFQLISKFIEDENYFKKVKNQPYLVKQVFFYRLHWLRTFSIDEIEFLISKDNFDYSIHELKDLKSAKILKYSKQGNDYIYINNWINNEWKDNLGRTSTIFLILFIISVFVISIIYGLTKSSTIFIFCLIMMILVEVWVLKKHDTMKVYIRDKEIENS